ncbi:MAG: hypothetical protein GTO03_08385, partial [Planctomycetales bacterium]|nr:hypothetical protein [Planctomycetales bacterium]
ADVHAWLERRGMTGDWLTELDAYYADHLPATMTEWLGGDRRHPTLRQIGQWLDEAVAPLSGRGAALSEWAVRIQQVL